MSLGQLRQRAPGATCMRWLSSGSAHVQMPKPGTPWVVADMQGAANVLAAGNSALLIGDRRTLHMNGYGGVCVGVWVWGLI